MPSSVKQIATLLTCVVMFYGYSYAAEVAAVTTNTLGAHSVDNTKDTNENRTLIASVGSIQDKIGQVNQRKDVNDVIPTITNDTHAHVRTAVSGNEPRGNEPPVAAISKRQGSDKPVNQSEDVNHIVPVILNDTHVDSGNIFGENKNSKGGKPVSAISRKQGSVEPVNQSKDVNDLMPVMTNITHSDVGNVSSVNKTSGSGTPTSFASITDSVKPVNQSQNVNDILPVTIKDTGNVGLNESRTSTAPVSSIQDKTGPVNQSKDVSEILPVMPNNTRIDADKATSASETIGSPEFAISVIESVKPVNQSKDTSGILPTMTNVTKIGDKVNVNHGNGQEPVNQAKDISDIVPVETNYTNIKEIVNINGGNVRVSSTVSPPLVAIDNKVQPISDVPSVDLNVKFNSIGTDYCLEKSRCNSTVASKTCSCDRLCGILEDCCEDADIVRDVELVSNQFICTHVDGFSAYGEGLMVVSKCPPFWNDDVTKRLCEQTTESDDIFSQIPVSDQTESGFIYKNRHCAHCNNVYKYEFWRASVECLEEKADMNISDTKNCKLSFQMPNEFSPFRKCNIYSKQISVCPASYIGDEIRETCAKGFYSKVYSDIGNVYRNKHCAFCNGVYRRRLYCEPQLFASIKVQSRLPPKIYSFRLIVDFNSMWEVQNEQFRKPFSQCNNNEIYDPFANTCREIFCPSSTTPFKGKCSPIPQNVDIRQQSMNNETMRAAADNCTLTKIDADEFEYINNTNAIIFRDIILNDTEYSKNGSDVFACLEKLNLSYTGDTTGIPVLYQYDKVESFISLVGLVVSITASLLTLFVYILFPQLLNTPGKNIVCLIISLIVSQVLFLVAAQVANIQDVCTALAIAMHYFFFCAFCWMNVIAFDLWITFSHKFVSQRHQTARSKRFFYYSIYAWCLPLLIVGIAVFLNFAGFDREDLEAFRPKYGQSVCWITSRNALLVFFAGPLAIFKLFDFVSFGFTAYHITKARKQGAFARKGPSTSSFLINLRLSLVMGLTWAFAFVANFTNNTVMWYLFIIFNTLQGLFIALSFLCTRKVLKLFREKYTNTFTQSSGTQMTTRPSYKSSE
ncbi:uncharacterized protein LOC128556240 [Mercenaria mercenaria]|uniref:uncharacterized protein LOC128556240 n=1 Tax=Mercenaria mercenaria TaxID=6596 RepID=UPI00234FB1A7|nr:uncharacterized protein LOC128556240 [Mercenaria mercenaria]